MDGLNDLFMLIIWKASVCRKPPSYVPYKGTYEPYDGTFGALEQGQRLDV